MSAWIYWIIVTAVLLILELATGTIAALCAAAGCVLAAITAIIGLSVEFQFLAFVVGLILAFIFLAPLVNRYRKKNPLGKGAYNSNMEAMVGKEGVLDRAIPGKPGHFGHMKLDGANWQVRSENGQPIAAGTPVRIVNYDSIILIVKEITA